MLRVGKLIKSEAEIPSAGVRVGHVAYYQDITNGKIGTAEQIAKWRGIEVKVADILKFTDSYYYHNGNYVDHLVTKLDGVSWYSGAQYVEMTWKERVYGKQVAYAAPVAPAPLPVAIETVDAATLPKTPPPIPPRVTIPAPKKTGVALVGAQEVNQLVGQGKLRRQNTTIKKEGQ